MNQFAVVWRVHKLSSAAVVLVAEQRQAHE